MIILCSNCKYLHSHGWGDYETCDYPDNNIVKYNWYMKWLKQKRHPKRINKNNDCKWFEKIERPGPPAPQGLPFKVK